MNHLGSRSKDAWQGTKISGHQTLSDKEELASTASKESIIPNNRIVTKTEVRMEVSQQEENGSHMDTSYHRSSESTSSVNARRF
jgi:hypothetical protein